MPFDPLLLTPDASLNRVILASAPQPYTGKRAYDLLSRAALLHLIAELSIDQGDPFAALDEMLTSEHPAALKIAGEMGTRLYWLLHTLQQGNPRDRAERPEWDASHWSQWAQIAQIKLGGGLVAGKLGQIMVNQAQGLYPLEIAPQPALLPITGVAKTTGNSLIFDFGQTHVKVAFQQGDQVTLLWSRPAPQTDDPQAVFDHMVALILEACAVQPLADVHVILASYLTEQGQPVAGGGTYGVLRQLTDQVREMFIDLLQKQSGTLRFWHDGTAAAHFYAGQPRTAVIMLGTALGIGFTALNALP